MVDVDDLGELERQEALVAAGKGSLGGLLGTGLGATLGAVVVVTATAEGRRADDVDGGVAAAAAGRRRRGRGGSSSSLGRGSRGFGGLLSSRRAGLGRKTTSVLLFIGQRLGRGARLGCVRFCFEINLEAEKKSAYPGTDCIQSQRELAGHTILSG